MYDKCPCYVLHEKVVGMASRKVDVKPERQRAGYKHLVLIQLWHVDVQSLVGVGFRSVEGYSFDSSSGLHCPQSLTCVRREK